jgi:hypothetical protein
MGYIFFLGFFVITNIMTSRKKHGQEWKKKESGKRLGAYRDKRADLAT